MAKPGLTELRKRNQSENGHKMLLVKRIAQSWALSRGSGSAGLPLVLEKRPGPRAAERG